MARKATHDPSQSANWLTEIVKQARLIWSLWRDPRLPLWLKLIPPATFIYLLWPVDALPDFLAGLGQLDDLAVILLGMRLFIALAPEEIVRQHLARLASRWHVEPPPSQPAPRGPEIIEGQYRAVNEG